MTLEDATTKLRATRAALAQAKLMLRMRDPDKTPAWDLRIDASVEVKRNDGHSLRDALINQFLRRWMAEAMPTLLEAAVAELEAEDARLSREVIIAAASLARV